MEQEARRRSRRKTAAFAVSAILISIFAAPVCFEIGLRIAMPLSRIFNNMSYDANFLEKYFKYTFYEANRGRDDFRIAAYSEELGWDVNGENNFCRGRRCEPEKTPGILELLAVGDSYTFGEEVGKWESYPAALENMFGNAEVFNMGVGGYGIDQAFLKYRHKGKKYKPDLLLFGIHDSNYERSLVEFTYAPKPVLRLDPMTGALETENQPPPTPAQSMKVIAWQARLECRSLALFRASLSRRPRIAMSKYKELRDRTDNVMREMFKSLKSDAAEDGTLILVVLIPYRERFGNGGNVPGEPPTTVRLKKIFGELDIEYLDAAAEWSRAASREEIFRNYYFDRKDGHYGHCTPLGNKLLAEAVAERLLTSERFQGLGLKRNENLN